jgi:hypothetical protein
VIDEKEMKNRIIEKWVFNHNLIFQK